MSEHRSVRRYDGRPVPDDAIREAVGAAEMAATSSWVQAYSLLQITDPERRKKLRELTGDQAQVELAGAFFVVCADIRRHQLVARAANVPCEQNLETFMLGAIDASLFAQNLVLAFESMGYGICYIGGLRTRLPEVDHLLEIPDGVMPLYGLCVGIPAEEPSNRPRLPVDAVWMKDAYASDETMMERIAAFDEVAARYYQERGAAGRNWTGGLWRKFRQPVREHLLAYYTSKGARFE
jgi:FMN reductase (NADPH)